MGIPSLILANEWELRHLYIPKRQLDVEKKIWGETGAEKGVEPSIPHSFFDIDGASQDSEPSTVMYMWGGLNVHFYFIKRHVYLYELLPYCIFI